MIKAIVYQTSKRRSWNFVICALMRFILFNRYKTFSLAHPNQVFGSRFCIYFFYGEVQEVIPPLPYDDVMAKCNVFRVLQLYRVGMNSLSRRSVKYIRLAAAHDRDCRWYFGCALPLCGSVRGEGNIRPRIGCEFATQCKNEVQSGIVDAGARWPF